MYKIAKFFKTDQRISQKFGVNPDDYIEFGFKAHEGVDYATAVGTELRSPFDGIILRDTDDAKADAYGKKVVVWDPAQKIAFWFCHLDGNVIVDGQKVKKGDILGFTGNTGNSTGPHCHVNFCETDASGNRLNTTNGYKGFLDFTKYCEFEVPSVDIGPVGPAKYDFGDYGKMEIQQVISILKAKDQDRESKSNEIVILKAQVDGLQKKVDELLKSYVTQPSAPESHEVPTTSTPVAPTPDNSFAVLFSAFVTFIKGLLGKKTE